MKIQELHKLAEEGKLFVAKTLYREHWRIKYFYDTDRVTLLGTGKIPYKVFTYKAWTKEMEAFWKIRKGDMKDLIEKGAILNEKN